MISGIIKSALTTILQDKKPKDCDLTQLLNLVSEKELSKESVKDLTRSVQSRCESELSWENIVNRFIVLICWFISYETDKYKFMKQIFEIMNQV